MPLLPLCDFVGFRDVDGDALSLVYVFYLIYSTWAMITSARDVSLLLLSTVFKRGTIDGWRWMPIGTGLPKVKGRNKGSRGVFFSGNFHLPVERKAGGRLGGVAVVVLIG